MIPIHVEWQTIWNTHGRTITYAPVGAGMSVQVRKRTKPKPVKKHDLFITYIFSSEVADT